MFNLEFFHQMKSKECLSHQESFRDWFWLEDYIDQSNGSFQRALFINDKKVAFFIQRVWRWENQKWMGLMILVRASRTDFQDVKPVPGIWMIVQVTSDTLNLPVRCFMLDFWIKLSGYYVVYVTTAQNYWLTSTIQRWLTLCISLLVRLHTVYDICIQENPTWYFLN